jgi:ferredoxin
MAYVITENCTKDALCIDACPVDCIHPTKDEPAYEQVEMLYVDPVECIDCGACVPVCEASAVFALDEVPPEYATAVQKNAAYFGQ